MVLNGQGQCQIKASADYQYGVPEKKEGKNF